MKTFRHTGKLGDLIYALPAIRKAGGGRLLLEAEPMLQFERDDWKPLIPLLLAQSYVTNVTHDAGRIDHDFARFREGYAPGMTLAEIQWRHIHKFGAPKVSDPWLAVDSKKPARPVIARSARYHNPQWDQIWPEVLQDYPDALFLGTEEEHRAFERQFGPVEYQPTEDLLEAAKWIKNSRIFIGNQSCLYAIAEGLKVRAILEVSPKMKDCRFPARAGLHYIERHPEWAKIRTAATFMVALQFHPEAAGEARDLLQLICDLEPVVRHDVEFTLIGRFDVDREVVDDLAKLAREKFKIVHPLLSKRQGKGWPDGCNDLWQDLMRQVGGFHRHGITKADAVLTFEPDCLPLRRDWLNVLKREWLTAKALGKSICGHAHGGGEDKSLLTHINGNAIFSTSIYTLHPELEFSRADAGWDVEHGQLLLRHGYDTPEIGQTKRMKTLSEQEYLELDKHGHRPALWHGLKDSCGIPHARKYLIDGWQPVP